MNRVHLNALQGSVFRPNCIWISTLLRWSYCYFEQDLPTVTPLMPPWCVIHSASKTSCEAFHSSKPRALFFHHREPSAILQKKKKKKKKRLNLTNRNKLWQNNAYMLCVKKRCSDMLLSVPKPVIHIFLGRSRHTNRYTYKKLTLRSRRGRWPRCSTFPDCGSRCRELYLCCMAHRCQGPQPLTSFYPRAHFKLSHIKRSG